MAQAFAGVSAAGHELYGSASRSLLRIWNTPAEKLSKNPLTAALSVASRLYEKGLEVDQARLLRERTGLPAYVISVGNIVCGGTGKTPLVMWLCRYLELKGFHSAVLSRGYGRKERSPARVKPHGDPRLQSGIFGDEPVLMAATLPSVAVWVGRRRAESGRAALSEERGIDVLILDDGFQHLSLDRDLDIVLLDSRNPFGNGRTLPLGPLREPIPHLERADAFVLTHADTEAAEKIKHMIEKLFKGKPVFACRHEIRGFRHASEGTLFSAEALKGRVAGAFAGIARPEGFFSHLEHRGIEIRTRFCFPDHYRYSESDLSRILKSAATCGAEFILTTAKDAVRVPSAYLQALLVAELELDFGRDRDKFEEFLQSRLQPRVIQ